MMKRDYSRYLSTNVTRELNEVEDLVEPKPKNQENYARSYALRMLIHYLGDVHQPLHCSSRVDKNYPSGDKGGNMFTLPNHYESAELHAAWDSVLYEYHKSPPLVRTFPFKPF
jgi:hypothetical protein